MPNTMTVLTNGAAVLGDKQAQHFALCICPAVKAYIKTHRAEYEAWAQEQQGEEVS